MEPTRRQKDILSYMAAVQRRQGFPPSVREICAGLKLQSPGSMQRHLWVLMKGGFLEKDPGKKRAWKLTHKAWDFVGYRQSESPVIPLVGRIAAGTPILAEENREDELPIDPKLFGSDDAFALRVQGDSMKDAHIRDGDLAIIRPQEDAENGRIVAVMVEGLEPEATLKVLRRTDDGVELHPANEEYKPLVFTGAERSRVKVLGRLVGVIRTRP